MKIALKNIKVAKHLSEETLAFTATVYLNGKRVGIAQNSGHGGANTVSLDMNSTKEARALLQDTSYTELDGAISMLLGQYENKQFLKRHAKTKTIIRMDTDNDNQWTVFSIKFSPEVKKQLQNKYGDKIKIWGNELVKQPIEGDIEELNTEMKTQIDKILAES